MMLEARRQTDSRAGPILSTYLPDWGACNWWVEARALRFEFLQHLHGSIICSTCPCTVRSLVQHKFAWFDHLCNINLHGSIVLSDMQ